MPMIDVYAAVGTFPDKHRLDQDLANAVMKWEKVPPINLFKRNTAAFVHDLPAEAISNATVIAAISGTALAGTFEFALSCDLRIAEDGDYLIGLPEAEVGLLPGAGGTQRLPRTIGSAAALLHILMGQPLNPREAERKGLVYETVSGKAIDLATEIARRLSSHTGESLGYIKRLVRNATEMPLAQGLALERSLFLKLCASDQGLARMRSYEEKKITSPSRSIEI